MSLLIHRTEARESAARIPRLIAVTFLLSLTLAGARAAPKLPVWLQAAREAKISMPLESADAVVLHDESTLTFASDGKCRTVTTHAVRVLTREGRDAAAAAHSFIQGSEKIRQARAWLIRPNGEVRVYNRKEFIESAPYSGDLYSDYRLLGLPASSEALPGSVFAWEFESESAAIFAQHGWAFGDEHPVVFSRVNVVTPAGWKVEGITFNDPRIARQDVGSSVSWELRDFDGLEYEPRSPGVPFPMVGISIFPSEADARRTRLEPFATWSDVSRFMARLGEAPLAPDATVTAKAAELTAGLSGEWERIRAIADFVQRINYISIQTRLGEGGGYTPHSAAEVLRCGYGDCKDKANLMRSLLKAIGIESHYVGVAYEEMPLICEEWPYPAQFNHAIVAIRVTDPMESPAVADTGAHGRLLFFDPTNEYTILGDLPSDYQGSLALVVDGERGGLVRIPTVDAVQSRLERSITAKIDAAGRVEASLTETSSGQEAAAERELYRSRKPSFYTGTLLSWVIRGTREATIENVRVSDDPESGRFDLAMDFASQWYGRSLGGSVLMFKPVMVSRRSTTPFDEEERTQPIVITGNRFSERAAIEVPAGFRASEMPKDVELKESFGSFSLVFQVRDGRLEYTRALNLDASMVPATDYGRVRAFFSSVMKAEQQAVVFEKITDEPAVASH